MMKNLVVIPSVLVGGLFIAACQPSNTTKHNEQKTAIQASATDMQASHIALASVTTASTPAATDAQNGASKQINWTLVDSGVKAVDKASFKYPFALNSAPVKSYAEMYHVDNETSRYNLTVGMATNEILSKLLDQLGNEYVSHELTAGKNSAFVIHTTKNIMPSEHIYVIEEPFAKGLTIPVKLVNDGKK